MEHQRDTYLDYAATTPVDPRVVDAMLPYLSDVWGNPNSLYRRGREAYTALEEARERFARVIGAEQPGEVIFTAGGTEADNMALLGIPTRARPDGGHIIVSAFEHHAVLEPAHELEKRGYEVTYVKPRPEGYIDPDDVRAAMRDDTVLVSVMHANNEIGTLQPIAEIAAIAHERGAYVHTDAAQTLGKVPFDVTALGVDAATFSGHKIYAPKGIGALYLKRRTPMAPLIRGGGQESKRRSGTQNVAGAAALATAAEMVVADLDTEAPRLAALRDCLVEGVTSTLENTVVSATHPERLPNIAHLIIKGVEGEAMLLQLDARGIAVSTGSACSSGSLEPSHVLLSIGCPPELAHGSIRLSVGRYTTAEDVEYFLDAFSPIVNRLRDMSPVYAKMFGSHAG